MHITELPDDCLLHIFEQFESKFTSLLSKAFVHPAFVNVIGEILRPHQATLRLFDYRRNVKHFQKRVLNYYILRNFLDGNSNNTGFGVKCSKSEENFIVIRDLTGEPTELIQQIVTNLFFNIGNLMINSCTVDHIKLLENYQNLHTLTLIEMPDSAKIHRDLWNILNNQMPNLRHLHLFYENVWIPIPDKVPVLSRLESFTLHDYNRPNVIEIVSQLSSKCRQLRLKILKLEVAEDIFQRLISGDEAEKRICYNMEHLDIETDWKMCLLNYRMDIDMDERGNLHMLSELQKNFVSIKYLDLEFTFPLNYKQISSKLSRMPNLTEITFRDCGTPNFDAKIRENGQTVFDPEEWPLTPVKTVRKINLAAISANKYNKKFLSALFRPLDKIDDQLPHMTLFPALEEVHFVVSKYCKNRTQICAKLKEVVRKQVPKGCWHRCKLYYSVDDRVDELFFVNDDE